MAIGDSQNKEREEKTFRKINLVQIINEQNKKNELNLIDSLSMSDKNPKIATYDKQRGVLFLINKTKPFLNLKLFSVKLTNEISDDPLHEEEQHMKIHFVTETKLVLNS